MDKPTFKNSQTRHLEGTYGMLARIALFLSSSSSGVAICASLIMFIAPDSSPSDSPISWAICLIVGVGIGLFIDNMIVQRFAHVGFRELIALISRRFQFTMIRKLNIVPVFIFFGIGFYMSYTTSADGSVIVASAFQKPTEADKYARLMTIENDNYSKQIQPYQNALAELQQEIDDSKKSRKSKKLRRLIRKGDNWAIGEGQRIDKMVDKEYKKRLDRAQSDYDEHKEKYSKTLDASLAALRTESERQMETAKARYHGFLLMIEGFGVLPLFLGVALIFMSALSSVNLQLSKLPPIRKQAKKKKKSAATQSEYNSIYGPDPH